MAIKKDTLDQLLDGRDPKEVFNKDGLFDELKKALAERVLNAEIDDHLEGEAAEGKKNHRNGYSSKRVITETSKLDIRVPRDREGTFDPKLIARYQRRFPGFDDKIVSMYARGMTVREIQGHLLEIYGLDVSPDLISTVTDAVLETIGEWQNRPLEASYPLVFFDALRVKIRDEGLVRNKAVYIALGVQADGTKDILGLWIENTEGAKFWLRVMNELKNRGVSDVLIAVIDGLKGFPEAINAVFPQTVVQTCIVHLIRHSMDFASWKDRKILAGALKTIYRAKDADAARAALEAFDASSWGRKYPAIAQSWRRNWERVIPFFAFPEAVRRIIYTTNAIEALNAKLRRAVRTEVIFPPMTPRRSSCFSSCARPPESGECRRASGSRQRPNSPSCSTSGSFKRDDATRPAHKIHDSPSVNDSDQNITDASVLQLVHDAQPELGAFGVFDPKAQNILRSVRLDAKCNIDGFVAHQALVADFDPQRVEEDQRIARLQRAVLPFANRFQNRVRHRRDQIGRNFEPIDLKQMTLDLPHRHPARIHGYDLVVEAGKSPLVASDQLRIESSFTVTRNTKIELRRLGDHALLRIAVPMVLLALGRLAIKMIVDLSVQHTLRQSLLQLVEQAILIENLLRIAAIQKLIQSVFLDRHNRPPSASLWPRTQDS